jgi:hypothetical protein
MNSVVVEWEKRTALQAMQTVWNVDKVLVDHYLFKYFLK